MANASPAPRELKRFKDFSGFSNFISSLAELLWGGYNKSRYVLEATRALGSILSAAVLSVSLSGCVIGRIQPNHFQFVTVVEKTEPGTGGWRAACVHAKVTNGGTKDSIICRFGVELPVENHDGPISVPLAQRVAADCANTAAGVVLGSATDETPLGILCENFKTTYDLILNRAIAGAHATKMCHRLAKPVKFGF